MYEFSKSFKFAEMKTVDKSGRENWGRGGQVLEAYPAIERNQSEDIEQHYIVPWEMTVVRKKKTEDTTSSGQVAYF